MLAQRLLQVLCQVQLFHYMCGAVMQSWQYGHTLVQEGGWLYASNAAC